MSKNKDFLLLLGVSFAIVAILLIGVYYSPTFTQQQIYFNSLIYFLAVVFIASVTLLVLWHGFKEFAVMLAIILAMIISLFGIEAGLIAILFTYITWGFAFTVELLLAHNGVKQAIEWFKKHYTPKSFSIEYKIFYPMLIIMHILLEKIPGFIYKEPLLEFDTKELYEAMYNELDKKNKIR